MAESIVIFWFRRDLRLHDNNALSIALQSGYRVLPLFIFDTNILSQLEKKDKRVSFIYQALKKLNLELKLFGSALLTEAGVPDIVLDRVCEKYKPVALYASTDYEPYAIDRDQRVGLQLKNKGIDFRTFKDQVIFEKDEVLSGDGKPYTVFTPYSRKWLMKLGEVQPRVNLDIDGSAFMKRDSVDFISLQSVGFVENACIFEPPVIKEDIIAEYHRYRDFPEKNATSHLGVHLRFGTLSIRELVAKARDLSPVFLNELIWREFFSQILWHYPHVLRAPFKNQYQHISWLNNEDDFNKWCKGLTGYPLVDAGMRELNSTGFMHNRVRMVTASFLIKHLLIDWRWGEAYFASHLLDFELSSNNGNWQWVAGTGCDAAPYFRVFSPVNQQQKFDPKLEYIRKWIPEYGSPDYPEPIVDHKFARQRCIEAYKKAVN